ncbi:UDP-N-acetylmuramoyl-L-alanyl-D-glutamate--2,6-diaminopimelate ligase [Paenibacillus kobensis]|uniref:UDP-N-acetylmuramoyl-L-alanyl-D-glutamate--2, 6-diaminopimelate ligase n=1 Tax=Paenibacillus kobensis TaxID=59841 RepID=UPI000FD8F89D|nr:UDP-N-acetylmuramoyl-L-alanyl-D-glutamate--2,6-diaminopimelate ligase [Paenibacillus kobensis]
MKLKELLDNVTYKLIQGSMETEVQSIAYDSRKVVRDSLFVCIKGFKIDGHRFIEDAVSQGAVAILVENEDISVPSNVVVIQVTSTREALSKVASAFYGHPAERMNVVGITGTNGKTSTNMIISSILETLGFRTGVVTTIEIKRGNQVIATDRTTHTTPESLDLQAIFSDMKQEGVSHLIMEATSMGLELHRVDDCNFHIGVFTNLTQDHLDDHGTMENYLKAKMKLFKMCKHGVINMDDPVSEMIKEEATCSIMTYGINSEADVRALNIRMMPEGSNFALSIYGEEREVRYRIPGTFSVYNAMAAAGVCSLLGLTIDEIVRGLESVEGVKGRIERIPSPKGYSVFIDFAHSPDALQNILQTIRQIATGKMITVFGCGGDRDKTKRPIMGEIAGKISDYCIITSDNPRSEVPLLIIEDIEAGLTTTGCDYIKIEDRTSAIEYALQIAGTDDVVVICGRGHENVQELKDRVIHLDDAEIVHRYIINT